VALAAARLGDVERIERALGEDHLLGPVLSGALLGDLLQSGELWLVVGDDE
jgi:hypothetical protein